MLGVAIKTRLSTPGHCSCTHSHLLLEGRDSLRHPSPQAPASPAHGALACQDLKEPPRKHRTPPESWQLTAVFVCLQGSPATTGCGPPAGRSCAAAGAGARSAGRRGSPNAGAWRPASPPTFPCAAPMGGFTKTTVSSTAPPACWRRRSSSPTARTVSLKVGRWLPSPMIWALGVVLLMPFSLLNQCTEFVGSSVKAIEKEGGWGLHNVATVAFGDAGSVVATCPPRAGSREAQPCPGCQGTQRNQATRWCPGLSLTSGC